mgnify:CR=1 FL=1
MKQQWKYALTAAAVMSAGLAVIGAQGAAKPDPRVGLKAGVRDAGQAIRNMELVSSLAKPAGFFNTETPLGNPIQPEQPETPPAPGAPAAHPPRAAAPPTRLHSAMPHLHTISRAVHPLQHELA